MVMKLIFEDNNGMRYTVECDKDVIVDNEIDLDINLALDPLWEKLKVKVLESLGENNV